MERKYKKGVDRQQFMLLPPSVEDYVTEDNPVRAIDVYVDSLSLSDSGFQHALGNLKAGQPSYAPGDLLKLYLYGYLNRVRSSRRLETETLRNLEVIWLLKGLRPSYKTIADFRKKNPEALKRVNRNFVMLCKELQLFGGEFVGVDGAFFRGDASKASISTEKRLKKNLERLDGDIEKYLSELENSDRQEDVSMTETVDLQKKLKQLKERRQTLQNKSEELKKSGETQVSLTDPDARLLTKTGQSVAGYNVQIAVDEKNKLLVLAEVTNEGNDSRLLAPIALKSKAILETESLEVAADAGYYQQEGIKECIDGGIVPYVPIPNKSAVTIKQGRFLREAFLFELEKNRYKCPADKYLTVSGTQKKRAKIMVKYASRAAVCRQCSLRENCLPPKTPYRQINRWEHEEVIEDHRQRMLLHRKTAMIRRASLAEHPFGTLKQWCGWTHFLVRGKRKVSGEMSLLMLCYNFKRVLSIVGLEIFRKICERKMELPVYLRFFYDFIYFKSIFSRYLSYASKNLRVISEKTSLQEFEM